MDIKRLLHVLQIIVNGEYILKEIFYHIFVASCRLIFFGKDIFSWCFEQVGKGGREGVGRLKPEIKWRGYSEIGLPHLGCSLQVNLFQEGRFLLVL